MWVCFRWVWLVLAALVACAPAPEDGTRLRLAYMARLTHAPALTALESGRLSEALPGVRLEPRAFEFGNAIVEALFAGEIDVAYLGPNPAINAFVRSHGAVVLVAGVAEGGSALVVRPEIRATAELAGKRLASPQVASTQDIALRRYLARHGLSGVSVLPMSAAEIRIALRRGEIDGAWLSEPLVSELVLSAGAKVLVDEADEWPAGRYPTTVLAVRARYLEAHRDVVTRLVEAHRREVSFVQTRSDEALALSRAGIERVLGKRLPDAVARRAWQHVSFTSELSPVLLERLAGDARAAGFLPPAPLAGLSVELSRGAM